MLSQRCTFVSWIGLITLLLAAFLASGASAAPPQDFDALLERIASERAAHEALDAERERAFLARRDRQKVLLDEAVHARDAAKLRSDELSARFDSNELHIAQEADQLKVRLGSLGELVGVVQQVASDAYSIVHGSLVSAQFPGRDALFTQLSTQSELATVDQLAAIAEALLREAAETGQVRRFEAEVANADGVATRQEVVRVGPFMAVSLGQFVAFSPTLERLMTLPRQPGGEIVELARAFEEATGGHRAMAIDPSRGVLLDLYVQRPNLLERIEKGETVGYVIIAVGVAGMLAALLQAAFLIRVRMQVGRQLAHPEQPTTENPLGRVLASYRAGAADVEDDAEIVELRVSEAVLREIPKLERFQAFLRLSVAAGPLLGLIGTVIGMIVTFQSITESGSSDPRLMATGIGQAMIATVLGLGIAIPLLFANAGLVSLSSGIVQILEEQSTGLLAGLLERRRDGVPSMTSAEGRRDG